MDALEIPFKIVKIEENQFSLFNEALALDLKINQSIGFGFNADIESKTIAVAVEFLLQKDNIPLLKQGITCYFQIEEKSFNEKLKQETRLVLPCAFGKHLATITTGTLRGVLFSNTKGTDFDRFIIGLINIDNMFDEDIVIQY